MKYNELEKDLEGSGHNLTSVQSHNNSGGAKENHNKPQDTSAPGKIQTEHKPQNVTSSPMSLLKE
jgi:hypothetical protein